MPVNLYSRSGHADPVTVSAFMRLSWCTKHLCPLQKYPSAFSCCEFSSLPCSDISCILVDSLHCIPADLAWTGWENEESGKCIDFITSTFVNGFVNIAVDTVMVSMPVNEVLKLKLSRRKRMGVAVMFGMGPV
jgi:hypothetical protein